MNLKKFDENLELLPSVGAVINTKNGDVYDIMADNTIDGGQWPNGVSNVVRTMSKRHGTGRKYHEYREHFLDIGDVNVF